MSVLCLINQEPHAFQTRKSIINMPMHYLPGLRLETVINTPAIICLKSRFDQRYTDQLDHSLSIQPLTILGVTGPFSVLAENIYTLCIDSFGVSGPSLHNDEDLPTLMRMTDKKLGSLSPFHGMVFNPRRMDALHISHHKRPRLDYALRYNFLY